MSRPVMCISTSKNTRPTNNVVSRPVIVSEITPPLPPTPPPTPDMGETVVSTTMGQVPQGPQGEQGPQGGQGPTTYMWSGDVEVFGDMTKVLTFPYLQSTKHNLKSMDIVVNGFGNVDFFLTDLSSNETLTEFRYALTKDINVIHHDNFEKLPEETDNTAIQLCVKLAGSKKKDKSTVKVISVALNM